MVVILAALMSTLLSAQVSAECVHQYDVLDGPVEYVMGGNDFWEFGPAPEGTGMSQRKWGSYRLLSNLKARTEIVARTERCTACFT